MADARSVNWLDGAGGEERPGPPASSFGGLATFPERPMLIL